jgi:hypothetical protein
MISIHISSLINPNHFSWLHRVWFLAAGLALLVQTPPAYGSTPGEQTFASPQDAVNALVV